jgi:acyl-CoA synthetase (AMP-forming)/AMP-acid ligase II
MLEIIEQERVTRLVGWTLLSRITSDPTLADRDLSWLSELEPSRPTADPGLRHNSLGMSETSGPHTASAAADNEVDLPERLRGSFGPPVPGVQHKVVDPENPSIALPEGVEGDLLVRGYSLMDGLYKKERSEAFDQDGWYRTGDRGYFDDSYLFFTGRSTEMIKTGGANVAPREVELVLESLPGVQVAFVVGLPDPERGQLVGCLVCPEPDREIDPVELRGQLRELVSTYKVPRVIKVVPYEEAPWLPSGKISKPGIVDLLSDRHDGN